MSRAISDFPAYSVGNACHRPGISLFEYGGLFNVVDWCRLAPTVFRVSAVDAAFHGARVRVLFRKYIFGNPIVPLVVNNASVASARRAFGFMRVAALAFYNGRYSLYCGVLLCQSFSTIKVHLLKKTCLC